MFDGWIFARDQGLLSSVSVSSNASSLFPQAVRRSSSRPSTVKASSSSSQAPANDMIFSHRTFRSAGENGTDDFSTLIFIIPKVVSLNKPFRFSCSLVVGYLGYNYFGISSFINSYLVPVSPVNGLILVVVRIVNPYTFPRIAPSTRFNAWSLILPVIFSSFTFSISNS